MSESVELQVSDVVVDADNGDAGRGGEARRDGGVQGDPGDDTPDASEVVALQRLALEASSGKNCRSPVK